MARASEPLDIDGVAELVRLAREVRDTGEPCLLREGGEVIAVLVPLELADDLGIDRPFTEEEIAASRSAAGGWKHIDTDKLIEDIYARRGRPARPAGEP